jgi:hypothetical protein
MAVIAVIAWAPRLVMVFMSAWMPAPPHESEPAMTKTYFKSRSPGIDVLMPAFRKDYIIFHPAISSNNIISAIEIKRLYS